ncbi:MAG: hypothetical protein SGI87_04530, partial [Flavobacteriales bacterium]|nr:hypothetical protein [Flavobacteriales bacterium]
TPAYSKLLSGWEAEIRDRSHEIFNKSASMNHHSIAGHKIAERRYANFHVSALLRDLYPFVPNMGNIDKLSVFPKIHPTGNKIAPTVASQLFTGNGQITFASLPKESSYISAIDGAFVNGWGLFKKTSNAYILQEPTNQKVRDAWELISKHCDLKGETKKEILIETLWKILSDAPYGYNQITFTVLLAGWLSFYRQEVIMIGIPDPTKKGKAKNDQSMQPKSLEDWAASNIFEKADTFVDEWIVKFGAKIIRSLRVSIPVVPTLPTDYEKAIAYISQAENFLKENTGIESNSVREWKDRLSKTVKEFDRWYEPIKKVESLSIDTPLSQLVPSYSPVLIDFSVTDIVKSSIYTDTQHRALQRMQQLLDERFNELRIDPQSIEASQDCNYSLSNLESAISLLESNSALPEHYIQQLGVTKSAIVDRKAQIQAQELIKQKLREIKARFDSLSPNATQSDYVAAIDFIEEVANEFSKIKSEEIYTACLQKIGDFQENLQQQLQQWGSLYISENLSNELASELRDTIGKQSPRYTIANDQERLQEISEYLKQKILNIQIVDDLIKNNNRKLRQAEQELKAIRDAKALNVMFDGYKRTDILQLGTNHKIDTADQQAQLAKLKKESLQVLIEKLTKTIEKLDTPISKSEEYNHRKNILQQIQNLSSLDINFAEVQTHVEKVSIALEQRFEEFKKESQDFQIMREIRRLTPSNSMTIRSCEENTHKIQQLSRKLNHPETYIAEYTQRIEDFQKQIDQHIADFEHLQGQIDTIKIEKELLEFQKSYHKSDLIFKDSSRYADYQKLQVKIDNLDEELAQVKELEAYKLKSGSIAICDRARQQLSEASQETANRFQSQVQEIDKYLSDRVNQYRLDLENFDQRLGTITGLKTAQKSQTELAQKSIYYLNSEPDELLYNQIRDRLNRLQTLFQLVDGTEPQTITEYDQRLQKMQQWLEEDSQLPEWLDDRYLQKRRETEKNRQTLLDKKRKEACEWVKSVDLELQAALADSDRDRQAIKATELIKRIRDEKVEYLDGLINELDDRLGAISQECQNILELDLESQIINRFRQLPQARRANLYAKLKAFLTDKTEEY